MENQQPLVSFCLFTYNQEDYIKEAVEGALNQTYSNLEIIISDDCSTDNTQQIIHEALQGYDGPHKITVNFNKHNLGLAEHVNKVLYKISKGDYIAMAAGDDISFPERISNSIHFLNQNTDVVALSTGLIPINSKGLLIENNIVEFKTQIFDLKYYLSDESTHINGASRIFRRTVLNYFPPLSEECPTEDTTFLLRCYLIGKVAQLDEILVKYRKHENNITSQNNFHKININKIINQYINDIEYANEQLITREIAVKLLKKINLVKKSRKKRIRNHRLKLLAKRFLFFSRTLKLS